MFHSARLKKIFLTALSLLVASKLCSQSALAAAVNAENLRMRDDRPNMVDIGLAIETARAGLPPTLASDAEAVQLALTRIIPSMEAAYPGLRYVMIGRDSAFLADAIDAFYISRGQLGRVLRIPASRDTLSQSDERLFELLRENGFNPSADGSGPPYVLFDRTNYDVLQNFRDTSQMRRLLSAGYRGAMKLGIKPEQLKHVFSGIAINPMGAKNASLALDPVIDFAKITKSKIRRYFKKWSSTVNRTGFHGIGYYETRLLQSPVDVLTVAVPSLIDRAKWHETYLQPQIESSGALVVPHGPAGSTRGEHLSEMMGLWSAVQDPRLQDQIDFEFEKLGVAKIPRSGAPVFLNLLTTEAKSLETNQRLQRMKLIEQSSTYATDIVRGEALASTVRDAKLQETFRKLRSLSGDLHPATLPVVAGILLRFDLLLKFKADLKSANRRDLRVEGMALTYKQLLYETLNQIDRLAIWTARAPLGRPDGLRGLNASEIDLMQNAFGVTDHPEAANVIEDLAQLAAKTAPRIEREIKRAESDPKYMKIMIDTSKTYWKNWFRTPIEAVFPMIALASAVGAGASITAALYGYDVPSIAITTPMVIEFPFLLQWFGVVKHSLIQAINASEHDKAFRRPENADLKQIKTQEEQTRALQKAMLPSSRPTNLLTRSLTSGYSCARSLITGTGR